MIKIANNLKNLILDAGQVSRFTQDRIPISQLSPHQKNTEELPLTEGISTFTSELFNIPGAFNWWANEIAPQPKSNFDFDGQIVQNK